MRSFLLPFSALYGAASNIRNRMFDLGLFHTWSVPCPVISVGNITMGGTGKTPLVDWLAKELVGMGYRPLILSRGYGGSYTGIKRVDPSKANAEKYFGDEPVLLAEKHQTVPVYVTRKRGKFAPEIYRNEKPDVILLDDGFQHRYLNRKLDIVVVDATQDVEDLRLFPAGRGRENWTSLSRAHFIILTKTNLTDEAKLSRLRALIPSGLMIAEAGYKIKSLRSLDGKQRIETEQFKGPCLSLSAIGNPQSFLGLLAQEKIQVVDAVNFRDHHSFTRADLNSVVKRAEGKGLTRVVTTEKDAVKLHSWSSKSVTLWVTELEFKFEKGSEKLHEALRRIFN